MAVGNRLFAQSGDMGALPTLYAATQDLPGDAYIGPDGRGELRGYPALVGPQRAPRRTRETARKLWELSERAHRRALPARGVSFAAVATV